jgi:CBS domain containing-hemolysin-like protein
MSGAGLLLGVILGLLLVTVGAAAESALSAAGRVRLRAIFAGGGRRARAAERLVDDPERTQVATTTLRVLGVILFALAAITWLRPLVEAWIPGLVVLVLGLLLGLEGTELLATAWATHSPAEALLTLAVPVELVARLCAPLVYLLRRLGLRLSENGRSMRPDELRALVNVDEEGGPIEEEEIEMIAGIMELGGTKVREVMVPRIDIVALPIEASIDEALDVIISAGHSRLPVHRGSLDDIAGLLYAKDLLRCFRDRHFDMDLSTVLRSATFVPESKPVNELLADLQASKVHMAIVVDEYGGTAGLVTIEDLLEEIVGEIQDEYDAETPRIEHLSADEAVVDAGIDIDDVNRLMGIHLPTEEVDTLAGLVFTRLGKVPEPGERAVFDDAAIEVLELAGRRIRRVRVVRRDKEEPGTAAADGAGAPAEADP